MGTLAKKIYKFVLKLRKYNTFGTYEVDVIDVRQNREKSFNYEKGGFGLKIRNY